MDLGQIVAQPENLHIRHIDRVYPRERGPCSGWTAIVHALIGASHVTAVTMQGRKRTGEENAAWSIIKPDNGKITANTAPAPTVREYSKWVSGSDSPSRIARKNYEGTTQLEGSQCDND